ncbi:uncharacterized protein LOC128220130 [Mya arenaria]|uniref:uncharacterized protein LOC128202928 n=1 Tax=Mya arenaria TaxID=6604 RepID=UPI0022E36BB9|nr:uncharacterized protein LOC128202928 [Mya arenaria]XP_052784360.1 uncharacterized protein LOC128220130 [Mya arenaria]
MNVSDINTKVSGRVDSALPPIDGQYSANNLRQNRICGINAFSSSNMVSQNNRGTSSKSLIYRSIPPKPHTFTLSDMIGESLPQQKGVTSKKLGMSGSSSSEFAKRFLSRPMAQPKVVEFNVGKMSVHKRRRGINGFFPPVKLRMASSATMAKSPTHSAVSSEIGQYVHQQLHGPTVHAMSAPLMPTGSNTATTTTNGTMQLAPTSFSEVRPKSASRSISRASRTSRHSVRKTPESVRTAPPLDTGIVYPETFEFEDINHLPNQKTQVLPPRNLPWVFRYKVKRNMNELSKIMANKNPQLVDV